MESISKRGDTYLRTLLIHGAQAVVHFAKNKIEPEGWLYILITRRNKNIAAVALANINLVSFGRCLSKAQHFAPVTHQQHAQPLHARGGYFKNVLVMSYRKCV